MELESKTTDGNSDRIAWLALKLLPDVGNRSILRLVEYFGSPEAVLKASPGESAAVPGLREKAVAALRRKEFIRSPEAEWERLKKEGIELVCLGDERYPSNLRAIPDPPAVLFMRGGFEPRDLVSVAVVGSRAASHAGMAFTEKLCADLARCGITIVSGLAEGIDGAAHRGALKGGGRTIAVLGCGLDIDYPRRHSALRSEIVSSGALVSEFPIGTPPAPGHFPQRNRIISGLALGVVVVEAAQQSGSLITARFALEQGREVFAVPGVASDFRSVGSHRLLKQGAKLVESAEDILEEIRPLIRPSRSSSLRTVPAPPEPTRNGLSEEEGRILDSLDRTPKHIDDVSRTLGLSASRVMAVLLALEIKGVVRQLPGKYFVHFHN